MSIFKRFNGVIPLLMLLCLAVAQPGWASSPTPAMMGGPSLPPDETPTTRANSNFYTIITECEPTIGGSITAPSYAAAGETVYITVSPNDGYIINHVSGRENYNSVNVRKDETTGQYYFVMPSGNFKLTAEFSRLYNVTAECYPPEGGTITDYPTQAYGNQEIRWKATPNEGYYLNHTGNEGSYYWYYTKPNSDGFFDSPMFEDDAKIIAYFGTNTAHTITYNPAQEGSASVVPSAMPGERITVSITGTEDYAVIHSDPRYIYEGYEHYENRGQSISEDSFDYLTNTFTGHFTMPAADVNLLANLVPLHTLHMVCSPAEAGTITAKQGIYNGSYPLYYGNKFQADSYYYSNIYYTVTRNSGYTIDRIIISYTNKDGERITEEKPYSNNVFRSYGSNIDGDLTITAVFRPYGITVECVPAEGGTINVPSTPSGGDRVDFTVNPNANYFLSGLAITTDLGEVIPVQYDETSGQPYFTMPTGCGARIVANFATQHNITCVCDPEDAGRMIVLPNQVNEGLVTKLQFGVMANEGYALAGVTADNPDFQFEFSQHYEGEYQGQMVAGDIYTFNMPDQDMVLTAHFVPAGTRNNITVNNETPERGTVDVVETAKPLETVHVTIQGTENFACIDKPLQLYYYDENHDKQSISVTASNIDYDNNVYTVDFVMPNAEVFVEPTFKPIYAFIANCVPSEECGLLGTPSNKTPFYGNKLPEGSQIRIYCHAYDGYELVSLTISSPDETGQPSAQVVDLGALQQQGYYDFTMPATDVTITATFGRLHSVTASINPEGYAYIHTNDQWPAGSECQFNLSLNDLGYDCDLSDISVFYVNQDNERIDIPVDFNAEEYNSYFYFTMPDADVTIHVDLKPTHRLNVVNDPEDGGAVRSVIAYGQTFDLYEQSIPWPVPLSAGREIKLNFEAYEGYVLQSVSLINEETGEETPLTAHNGYYTVIMPDANATVKATYTTMPSLYLLGTANGNSTWSTSGVPFEIVDGQCTAMVYFKGYSDDENEADGMGYFMLSTKSNENDDWDAIADNLLSAPSDKFPALQEGETSSVQPLSNEYHYDGTLSHRFMVPAGIYKITVSPDLTTMSIDRITPSTTIEPELYYESLGQMVTISGIDWVLNTILQINPDETQYEEHVTATDAAGSWETDHFSNKFALRSTGITTVTATNSVGYITASDTKQYYVFDQEDNLPLEFIEGSNLIDNPKFSIGGYGEPVTVGDELIGVWGAKNILWAKDQGQQSARYLNAPNGTTDFLKEVFKIQGRDWDQSNWVMLDFGTLYPDWETNEETYLAMHEKIASYVDHKIEARTVKGTYYAPGYYLMRGYAFGNYIYEYTKGMHRIELSEFPVAIEQPQGTTLGYPGYVEDPTEEAGKFYDDPSQYMYNHYTPVNFMGYVYKPSFLKNLSVDENPFVYSASSSALSDAAEDDTKFFFMQPKDAEVAHVWAVWKGTMTFTDDYSGRQITRDVFETYQPGTDAQGHTYNSYGIEGAFQVYSWQWNRLPATDADQTPRYGKPEGYFKPNTPYLFHIAILHAYNTHQTPPPPVYLGLGAANAADMEDDYDAESDVEFGANLGAGSAVGTPIASTLEPNSIYRVFPLDMSRPEDSETGVDEAVIDRNDAAYEIVDITYYNVMGMASKRPFDGINIEVTTYSDGHKTSRKILTRN